MTDRLVAGTETAAVGVDAEASALGRRRERLQAARSTASAAASVVTGLDSMLVANAGQRRHHEAGLQAARDHVAALKVTINATAKQHDKLRSARKDAGRAAVSAAQRAVIAERKYDRAVLADMVRREKDTDLRAHPDHSEHRAHGAAVTHADDPHHAPTTTRPRAQRQGSQSFS